MVSSEKTSDSCLSICNSIGEHSDDTASIISDTFNNQLMLAERAATDSSQFGNVAVNNSTDVHIGNKMIYQGPVTIKQLVCSETDIDRYITSATKVDESDCGYKGYDNPAFTKKDSEGTGENKAIVHKSKHRWPSICSHQQLLAISMTAVVLVVSLVTLLAVLMLRHPNPKSNELNEASTDTNEMDNNTPIEYPVDKNSTVVLPPKLRLVQRPEWLAQPPAEPLSNLPHPVEYVIISHTATEQCFDQAACTFHVRFIQTYHMESRNWSDIAYNFLVGGDGNAYEGRGWSKEGAHTFGYNSRSIGICFVGTFNADKPPERQITAAKQLISLGVANKYIKHNYKLIGARQTQTTLSPGAALFNIIKTWSHWTPNP